MANTGMVRANWQQKLSANSPADERLDYSSALATVDAHSRFQESCLSGNLYSGGMTLTSIANATFTTGTTGSTATPIAGVWNPSTSGKNLVILQVKLQVINTQLQVTGCGSYQYMFSVLNTAISTGNAPLNRLTLKPTGSIAKDMSGVALTGLTTTLTVGEVAGVTGGPMSNLSTLQTAVGLIPSANASIDNIDGAFIIPPGGVFGLFCTTTPVACSAGSSILWEEIPANANI